MQENRLESTKRKLALLKQRDDTEASTELMQVKTEQRDAERGLEAARRRVSELQVRRRMSELQVRRNIVFNIVIIAGTLYSGRLARLGCP